MVSRINPDRLNAADPTELARIATATIDAIQLEPPELQALAVALAFRVLSEHYGQSPQSLFTIVGNILADPDNRGSEAFRALSMYVSNEWTTKI